MLYSCIRMLPSGQHFSVVHRSERALTPRAQAVCDWCIAMRQAEDAEMDNPTTIRLSRGQLRR